MSTQLQNRLVGAIVLVALAVIILPDLLDGPASSSSQASFVEIPKPPPAVNFQQAPPPPAAQKSASVVQAKVAHRPTTAQSQAQEQLTPLKGSAWIIQLGVFRNDANAKALVNKLRQAGYQAHQDQVDDSKGLDRVFVGPELSRDKLEQRLAALEKLTGLKGRLHPFQPVQ